MAGSSKLKKLNLFALSFFFLFAGANHFISPEFYIPLIPSYFIFPEFVNYTSGVVEIILGLGLLAGRTREASAYGIIILMVMFIPSHIYFIQEDSCVGELCVAPWIGVVRLVVIHPLLILWAYSNRG